MREALLRLQDEHLIDILRNSGTYVTRIDLETVFEGQLVREALEVKIVGLAATRMNAEAERRLDANFAQQRRCAAAKDFENFYACDEAMHALICEIGSSMRLWRIIHSAKAQLDRVRRLAIPMTSHLEVVIAEHDDIMTGLKLRDPDLATAAMERHVRRVFDDLRRLIAEHKEFFSADSKGLLDSHATSSRAPRKRN